MRIKHLFEKLKESLLSILPVCLLTVLLNLMPIVNFTQRELVIFLASGLCLVIGMAMFNLGADVAMTPMGQLVGSGLAKSKKISTMFAIAFIMGALITVAEPDLSVLASQLASVIDKPLLIYFSAFLISFTTIKNPLNFIVISSVLPEYHLIPAFQHANASPVPH